MSGHPPDSPESPREEPKYPAEILDEKHLVVSDEKHTVVEWPPASPSLASLTSATILGPEPDFPFLSGSFAEPDYYYAAAFDEAEEEARQPELDSAPIASVPTNTRAVVPPAHQTHTTHLHSSQPSLQHSQQQSDQSPQQPSHQPPHQHSQDYTGHPLTPPGVDSNPTTYGSQAQNKKNGYMTPPSLSLKLFPSVDSLSRLATSPQRPRDIVAEPYRPGIPTASAATSKSNLLAPSSQLLALPPLAQDPMQPLTPSKPSRSPLRKLFKEALSPGLLAGRLGRSKDKAHKRPKSSGANIVIGSPSIVQQRLSPGAGLRMHYPQASVNSNSRNGSLPDLSDQRKPSGERVLFGVQHSDGRPF